MTQTISMAQARQRLTRLPEEFAEHPDMGAIAVTRRGEPVMALMPWEFYESLTETLEIMGDHELWTLLQRATRELAEGNTISLDALEERLGS